MRKTLPDFLWKALTHSCSMWGSILEQREFFLDFQPSALNSLLSPGQRPRMLRSLCCNCSELWLSPFPWKPQKHLSWRFWCAKFLRGYWLRKDNEFCPSTCFIDPGCFSVGYKLNSPTHTDYSVIHHSFLIITHSMWNSSPQEWMIFRKQSTDTIYLILRVSMDIVAF